MCSICGIVGKSNAGLIKAMCDSLAHRGPDDEGIYVDEHAAIGSRLLSIIILQIRHQRFSNEIEY